MSGIFNWLIEGYRLLKFEGLTVPDKVKAAIDEYREDLDEIGSFLSEETAEAPGHRLPTSELYIHYDRWAKNNGYRPMNNKRFVGELRRRCDVRRDGVLGNIIVGYMPYFDFAKALPEGFLDESKKSS